MKFCGSVETAVQETVFWPLVDQPVVLVGDVTWRARAEAAKARRVATARMSKRCRKKKRSVFWCRGRRRGES